MDISSRRYQKMDGCQPEQAFRLITALCLIMLAGLSAGVRGEEVISISSERADSVAFLPGDIVDIKFFYTPELNESQSVRQDGKITLQLIGDVIVEGKTPGQLRQDLVELYAPELKNPEIAVIARAMHGRRVYVGGEVNLPGFLPLMTSLTALEAILQAGGFNRPSARIGSVVIIRHTDGQRSGCKLDLKDALAGKVTEPFYLEPNDIVYVPQTKISKVTQWIDQNINALIPDFGFTYSRPIGAGTIGIQPRARVGSGK